MTSTLPIRIPQLDNALGGQPGTSQATSSSQGEGSAHAKAILFGEHAVVYGAPAVAIPIHELEAAARVESAPQGIRIESELFSGRAEAAPTVLRPVVTAVQAALKHVDKADAGVRVQILSAIPHSRGLGSSAAVAAAIARATAAWAGTRFSTAELYDIVQEAERVAHGNPSGLDARAVTADGTIRFDFGVVSPVSIGAPLHFVLADSGVAGSTAQAVGAVRARRTANPAGTEALIARLAEIAEGSIVQLATGNRRAIGDHMREAHELLQLIGVSSPVLDSLVHAAESAGALGAKMTGGGIGGCIIALAQSNEHAEQLGSALREAGATRTWTAMVPVA